jgi:hypothetical protein
MARFVNTAWYALTVVFAVTMFVALLFPIPIPIDGFGGYLFLGPIIAALCGYVLGPLYGVISVLIGTLLGMYIDPRINTLVLVYFTPIMPVFSALVAGLLKKKKLRTVPIIFIIATVIFVIGPIGMQVYNVLWVHLLALSLSLLLLVPLFRKRFEGALDMKLSSDYKVGVIVIWLIVFISLLTDRIFFATILQFIAHIAEGYLTLLPLYPLEIILASIVGCIAFAVVAIGIERLDLNLPTRASRSEELGPSEVAVQID